MSELEPVFVDRNGCIVANELGELYMKYEADKVIAEKDKEIAELQEQVHDYAHYGKWNKIWLNIAEQFKEAK